VAAPKGWKKGFLPGSLEPDEKQVGSVFGKTEMKVGDNCDGACKSKDWAAVVDKVYYSQYTGGSVKGKVVKDDKQKTSRTMVFQEEPTVTQHGNTEATTGGDGIKIITTWWTDGGSRHFSCTADLAKADAGLAAAFEKACSKVSVSGSD
jgi:hypothetical protein